MARVQGAIVRGLLQLDPSGNQVMKDGWTRERLWLGMNVLCFEMEVAQLMGNFHCLVVWEICDYAGQSQELVVETVRGS
jgi:hypothetical protein